MSLLLLILSFTFLLPFAFVFSFFAPLLIVLILVLGFFIFSGFIFTQTLIRVFARVTLYNLSLAPLCSYGRYKALMGNLSDINLAGLNLNGINLKYVNLSGVNMSGCTFLNTNFLGAKFDKFTKLPFPFDQAILKKMIYQKGMGYVVNI